MFHLILTACIASSSSTCQPILLPRGDSATLAACTAAAQRITEDWIAAHPGLVASGTDCTETPPIRPMPLTEIAPGIWFHQGTIAQVAPDNQGRIANLSAVIGADRVAVIDAGASRAEGQALYAGIRAVTDKPISHLILTHMHPDHVLGAEVFAEAGAVILANARLPLALETRAEGYLRNSDRLIGAQAMIGSAITLPDQLVEVAGQIDLGGRVLHLRAVPTAHTDNDLTVLDAATGTLFTGDLVFRGLTPALDGSLNGWLSWLQTTPTGVSRVVPGHGETTDNWDEAIAKQTNLLIQLRDALRKSIAAGQPMSEAVPMIAKQLQYLDDGWADFSDTIARDTTAGYKELEWE